MTLGFVPTIFFPKQSGKSSASINLHCRLVNR